MTWQNTVMDIQSTLNTAYFGLQTQQQRLDRNVAEIAATDSSTARDTRPQDRALAEQSEIAAAVKANARSLEAASDRIGTLIDISV